jgi:hypothetical protein
MPDTTQAVNIVIIIRFAIESKYCAILETQPNHTLINIRTFDPLRSIRVNVNLLSIKPLFLLFSYLRLN